MKKEANKIYKLITRYLILVLLGANLYIFYLIFTPLTVYSVFFILKLFYSVTLSGTLITFENCPAIELVRACIAGSAYYLLLILNLTTPMNLKKRILSIIFSFSALFIINVFRIVLFSMLFLYSFSLFQPTHLFFWYVLSSIIVAGIWLINIKIFRIKKIPAYSDFKFVCSRIKQ